MLATSLEAVLAETAAYRTYFRAAVATETLRINPDIAKVHFDLGVAYGEQGRTDEAIREYQAALRINPDYAEAHYNLGVILRATGPRR